MRLIVTNPNQVGQILRARRKARRVSQQQLAAKLDLSQNRLSEIESGVAPLTVERLIALANVLGLQLVLQDKADEPKSAAEW
jgi:HTH-type transcriptional regulator/antitoxin HipB